MPIVIRSLGASWLSLPKAEAGIMLGATAAASVPATNCRRERRSLVFFPREASLFIKLLTERQKRLIWLRPHRIDQFDGPIHKDLSAFRADEAGLDDGTVVASADGLFRGKIGASHIYAD